VTDLLIDTVMQAAKGDVGGYEKTLEIVRAKHVACATELFSPAVAQAYGRALEEDIRNLHDILRAVSLMRYSGEKIVELVSGHGEIWSARMLTALFQEGGHDFAFVDARKVLFVDESVEGGPEIMWERSQAALRQLMGETPAACPVITGFIASTSDGVATTLKRDGSDYSASIFGRLLEATGITIWTDVDGVLSADPRRVPEAKVHVGFWGLGFGCGWRGGAWMFRFISSDPSIHPSIYQLTPPPSLNHYFTPIRCWRTCRTRRRWSWRTSGPRSSTPRP
jgi:bifunctional aspartokinase / homoserine dehydrogenase 1